MNESVLGVCEAMLPAHHKSRCTPLHPSLSPWLRRDGNSMESGSSSVPWLNEGGAGRHGCRDSLAATIADLPTSWTGPLFRLDTIARCPISACRLLVFPKVGTRAGRLEPGGTPQWRSHMTGWKLVNFGISHWTNTGAPKFALSESDCETVIQPRQFHPNTRLPGARSRGRKGAIHHTARRSANVR